MIHRTAGCCVLLLCLLLPLQTRAALEVLGTDALGNQLIYDTDLDITWYDFSEFRDTWARQMTWAEGLSVTFRDSVFDDWRLPNTVDGPYSPTTYTGDGAYGWNITSSELGHLYYQELGITGAYLDDPGAIESGCGLSAGDPSCLIQSGPFLHLNGDLAYWSATDCSSISWAKWAFSLWGGKQTFSNEVSSYYGVAVRDGRVLGAGEVPAAATSFGHLKSLYR